MHSFQDLNLTFYKQPTNLISKEFGLYTIPKPLTIPTDKVKASLLSKSHKILQNFTSRKLNQKPEDVLLILTSLKDVYFNSPTVEILQLTNNKYAIPCKYLSTYSTYYYNYFYTGPKKQQISIPLYETTDLSNLFPYRKSIIKIEYPSSSSSKYTITFDIENLKEIIKTIGGFTYFENSTDKEIPIYPTPFTTWLQNSVIIPKHLSEQEYTDTLGIVPEHIQLTNTSEVRANTIKIVKPSPKNDKYPVLSKVSKGTLIRSKYSLSGSYLKIPLEEIVRIKKGTIYMDSLDSNYVYTSFHQDPLHPLPIEFKNKDTFLECSTNWNVYIKEYPIKLLLTSREYKFTTKTNNIIFLDNKEKYIPCTGQICPSYTRYFISFNSKFRGSTTTRPYIKYKDYKSHLSKVKKTNQLYNKLKKKYPHIPETWKEMTEDEIAEYSDLFLLKEQNIYCSDYAKLTVDPLYAHHKHIIFNAIVNHNLTSMIKKNKLLGTLVKSPITISDLPQEVIDTIHSKILQDSLFSETLVALYIATINKELVIEHLINNLNISAHKAYELLQENSSASRTT